MNFFETLIRPDKEEAEFAERSTVISAANQLQIGEFQFLQLAYKEWYDQDLPEAMVTKLFTTYMLNNDVPHWARHYARKILIGAESGLIDDSNPAFHRYDHDYHTSVPNGVRRFCYAVMVLTMMIGGGLLVANMSVKESVSILPPYFNKDELKQTEKTLTWGRSDTIPPARDLQLNRGP
ncbi:MAG: hypothetical protein ISR52_03385 [Rhodospirillales bacterium]|nr:hypothetical protein [Rhodospirillales bacterium]